MTKLRITLVLILLGLLSALGPSPAVARQPNVSGTLAHAQKKQPVAAVEWIKDGMVVRAHGGPTKPIKESETKYSLFDGDGLHTGAGEQAEVTFSDHSVMTLQERTDLVLCSGSSNCTKHGRFHLSVGTVAIASAPGQQPMFETAKGNARGQDTEFLASVKAGSTTFAVLHGVMFLQNGGGTERLTTNQQAVVTSFSSLPPAKSANVKAEFAWTDQIPKPSLGYDVSLQAEGGSVSDFSSERAGGNWSADNLNDGVLSRGWESGSGLVKDESVAVDLPGNSLYAISAIVLDPSATGSNSDPSMDLKDFEIRVSSSGSDGPFTTVFSGTCTPSASLQAFTLPAPVLGNAVELLARNNFGSPTAIAVAEMEVVANVAGFAYPSGLAISATGDMYVADSANDRIQVLSPNGDPLRSWGTKGTEPGQFRQPEGLALDHDGNVYVADSHNNRIQEFSSSGDLLAQFGTLGTAPGQFNHPFGIALDAAGNVYVTDSRNNRIQELSPQGIPLAQWGSNGSGPGQLNDPLGLAVGGAGNIFVADFGNNRIQKLSPSGAFMAQWTGPNFNGVKFNGPTDVELDRQGNMYIADFGNFHVHEMTSAGVHVATGPRRSPGLDQYLPQSLTIDAHGVVFATDRLNSRIVQFNRSLQVQRLFGVFGALTTVMASPLGLAVGPDGNVFVTDPRKSLIEERSLSGDLSATFGFHRYVASTYTASLGEFYYPDGLAVSSSGDIYVEDAHTVQKLSAAGALTVLKDVKAEEWVAVDTAGALYVVDPGSRVLQRVPAGSTGPTALGTIQISGARGVCVDSAGNVYIASAGSERVIKLTPGGAVAGTLGADAAFRNPQGVAVDRAGNIYVADAGTNQVVKLSANGAVLARYGAALGIQDPRGIAIDAEGDLFVASFGSDQIIKLSPAGALLAVWN